MSIRRARSSNLTTQLVERSLYDLSFSAGVPSQPELTITTATGELSWTVPSSSTAGPILGYGISVFPEGPTWVISGTTAVVSNYSPGVTYTFTVWGVNIAGVGIPSTPKSITIGFNVATGGTETTVSNYNGTGQTWKVHTFTSSSSLNITSAQLPFNILLVGNGNNGGGAQVWTNAPQGGGAGGFVLNETGTRLPSGSQSITIGGTTTLGSVKSSASGTQAGQATPGPSSTVTGTATFYGGGGGAGGPANNGIDSHNGPPGQAGGQGGGGPGAPGGTRGQAANGWGGGSGSPGTNGLGGGGGGIGGRNGGAPGQNDQGGTGGTGRAVIAYRIA